MIADNRKYILFGPSTFGIVITKFTTGVEAIFTHHQTTAQYFIRIFHAAFVNCSLALSRIVCLNAVQECSVQLACRSCNVYSVNFIATGAL